MYETCLACTASRLSRNERGCMDPPCVVSVLVLRKVAEAARQIRRYVQASNAAARN